MEDPYKGGSPMGDPQWEITKGDHPWGIHHGEFARANHLGWSKSQIWDFCKLSAPHFAEVGPRFGTFASQKSKI